MNFMLGIPCLAVLGAAKAAHYRILSIVLVLFIITPAMSQAVSQVSVLTQRNDNARSGTNLREAILRPSNVHAESFGKLFARDVDGEVYAQPLVVSGVRLPGKGVRSLVFVATAHNSVYAFDAQDPEAEAPLWQARLGPPVPAQDVGQAPAAYGSFSKEIGITGTPVIDAQTQTLYAVARTKTLDGRYHQRLHALDIRTGKERPGSPREIQAWVPGSGRGSSKGRVAFDPKNHNQCSALLLLNGVVYISWAAQGDAGPCHGWIIGYDARTLGQTTAFCTTPNGSGAGIWQSGVGPAADEAGYIYVVNGNGTVDTDTPARRKTEFGFSFLKLQSKAGQLSVADWFTPYNFTSLREIGLDTGSTSVVLVPGTPFLIAGSTTGMMYVLNRDRMGGFNLFADSQIVQRFPASPTLLYGTPIYWQREGSRPWIYSWGVDDCLKAFQAEDTRINPAPVSQSAASITAPRPGGFLSLSANGSDPQSGILWALQPTENASQQVAAGILRAFNASDLSQELWNSTASGARDDVGLFARFCAPTVANGRVYVASFSNQLQVYGLHPRPLAPPPTIASRSRTIQELVTLDSTQPGATIRYTLDGSVPTFRSPRYRTPFKLKRSGDLHARTFARGMLPSVVATLRITDPGVLGTGSGLLGSYYANENLSGNPVQQLDAGIDNQARPPGIGPDNWSARWEGQLQATHSGTFTFQTQADDGIRLWVNGQKLIDQWLVRGTTEDTASIELEAGKRYPIKVEYFQSVLGQERRLFWTPPGQFKEIIPASQLYAGTDLGQSGTGSGLSARYFKNEQLSGEAVERVDAQVNNQARPQGIPDAHWSARWTGEVQATRTGTFAFHVASDDGMRLWVGDRLLIDNWRIYRSDLALEATGTIDLEEGKRYPITVEYFQGDGGTDYRLLWTPPGLFKMPVPQSQLYPSQLYPEGPSTAVVAAGTGTGTGLLASYFKNRDLSGPAIERVDEGINNQERPDALLAEEWSARWTGMVQAPVSGTYLLRAYADDGIRVWVGNKLVIDNWRAYNTELPLDAVGSIALERGRKYPITVEYFQGTGGTDYRLAWVVPGQPEAVIPQSQLYPESDPGVVGTGTGFLARYYPNKELAGPFAERVEERIDNQAPPQGVGPENWSARWSGELLAPHSGEYIFSAVSDDGIRLWVNGQKLIDDWAVHGATQNQGTIKLEAGKKYAIKVEYFQGVAGLAYQLMWSNSRQPKMFIPKTQLYPSP